MLPAVVTQLSMETARFVEDWRAVILGLFEWEELLWGVWVGRVMFRNLSCLGKERGSSRLDSPRGFHVRRASWMGRRAALPWMLGSAGRFPWDGMC